MMLSAMLGSPICSCQCATGTWLVRMGRPALVAVITDLQEVAPFLFFQWGHGKIVQYQHVDARKLQQILAEAAVGTRHGQVAKQFRDSLVQGEEAIVAGFVRQRCTRTHSLVAKVRRSLRSNPRGR
jgi:hypothetical protein